MVGGDSDPVVALHYPWSTSGHHLYRTKDTTLSDGWPDPLQNILSFIDHAHLILVFSQFGFPNIFVGPAGEGITGSHRAQFPSRQKHSQLVGVESV